MAFELVGRIREKRRLQEALESRRSELIAVYGRRRIGKTYLIRSFYADHIMFSFSGLRNGVLTHQIENFMIQLRALSGKFENEQPKTWLAVFDLFQRYLKSKRQTKKKKVIFIDEFPWVDSMRSGFLPAFENFWNTYCTTRNDLIVVVCGSAASYMIKKIIRNRGGLHNRITRKIKLEPFTLSEVKAFLEYKKVNLPHTEILKLYMTFGGVAEYLEHIVAGDSAETAINRLCFEKGAQLSLEYEEVFKSLFDEGTYHEQIIQALASGAQKGMTRDELLSAKSLKSGGQFSKSLTELIESGFVEQYQSHRAKRKTTLYRIFDEFCLFHLKFMVPFKGNSWHQIANKPVYTSWSGFAFELICYKHLENIKAALHCNQISSNNYAWSNNNAQIDLVIDRADNMINLIEIKFYNDVFNVDAAYAASLRNKLTEFSVTKPKRKAVNTIMLTTFGTKGTHAIGTITNSLTCEALFQS